MNDVHISRYQIGTPTIQDWIGSSKFKIIEKTVDIKSIANPVLLVYLRHMPEEYFKTIKDGEGIINTYFKKLLDREQVRQNLTLSVDEQLEVLCKIAANFVQMEISGEDRDIILEIVLHVVEDNVEEYLSRYKDPEEAPEDAEQFSMKIVRHALLDRVSNTTNKIGFINDFIFGYFIAKSLMTKKIKDTDMINEKYILDSVDAYSIMPESKRTEYYSKISQLIEILSSVQKMEIQRKLLRRTNDDFENVTFHNFVFSDMNIEKYRIKNCIFTSCTFDHSKLDANVFDNCMFIDCKFFECDIIPPDNEKSLIFTRCKGNEKLTYQNSTQGKTDYTEDDYRRKTLELIWPIGRGRAKHRVHEANLFKKINYDERKKYINSIEILISEGLIFSNDGFLSLDYEKMSEIKGILDR